MKKITSFVLLITILASIFAVNSSAAGVLYVQSDFTNEEHFNANFIAGAYYIEDGTLFGYAEAKSLQSQAEWFVYDAVCEVSLADDELSDFDRYFSVVYPNTNLVNYGRLEDTCYMNFNYDIANKQCYLSCGLVGYNSENVIMGPVSYEGVYDDGTGFNTFGISVTRGRIRCFIDNKLIFDFIDSGDEYLIGLEDESTVPTKHVFWNDGNFVQYKDIKISSPEYLFPMAPAGEATTATTTKETTTRIEQVTVTDEKGEAVTDEKGEVVTDTVIITEAPADTNTGAVVGGNATATGDVTFIVVAAMVATLGCALIVKKVNVR